MSGFEEDEIEWQPPTLRDKWHDWSVTHGRLQRVINFLLLLLLAIAAGVLTAIFLWAVRPLEAPSWTGFGPTRYPLYSGYLPQKTFWDWLELLLVPLALGLAAALFSRTQQARQEHEREFERRQAEKARLAGWWLEQDRQEQEQMSELLVSISRLMLDYDLRGSAPGESVRLIARAAILGAFGKVNGARRGQILRFLFDAELINAPDPIIDLSGAALGEAELESARLQGVSLAGVDLHEAKMDHAILDGANLADAVLVDAEMRSAAMKSANLQNAVLSSAHLLDAGLQAADLSGALINNANLTNADLREANLRGANLVGADLSGAALQGADLSDARWRPSHEDSAGEDVLNVNGAIYDSATRWPDGFDLAAYSVNPARLDR